MKLERCWGRDLSANNSWHEVLSFIFNPQNYVLIPGFLQTWNKSQSWNPSVSMHLGYCRCISVWVPACLCVCARAWFCERELLWAFAREREVVLKKKYRMSAREGEREREQLCERKSVIECVCVCAFMHILVLVIVYVRVFTVNPSQSHAIWQNIFTILIVNISLKLFISQFWVPINKPSEAFLF